MSVGHFPRRTVGGAAVPAIAIVVTLLTGLTCSPALAGAAVDFAVDGANNRLYKLVNHRDPGTGLVDNVSLYAVDLETRQVVVDAKFVQANATNLNVFGVDLELFDDSAFAAINTFTPGGGKFLLGEYDIAGDTTSTQPLDEDDDYELVGSGGLTTVKNRLVVGFATADGTTLEHVIKALQRERDTTILSAPKITTLNGQPANFIVSGTRHWYAGVSFGFGMANQVLTWDKDGNPTGHTTMPALDPTQTATGQPSIAVGGKEAILVGSTYADASQPGSTFGRMTSYDKANLVVRAQFELNEPGTTVRDLHLTDVRAGGFKSFVASHQFFSPDLGGEVTGFQLLNKAGGEISPLFVARIVDPQVLTRNLGFRGYDDGSGRYALGYNEIDGVSETFDWRTFDFSEIGDGFGHKGGRARALLYANPFLTEQLHGTDVETQSTGDVVSMVPQADGDFAMRLDLASRIRTSIALNSVVRTVAGQGDQLALSLQVDVKLLTELLEANVDTQLSVKFGEDEPRLFYLPVIGQLFKGEETTIKRDLLIFAGADPVEQAESLSAQSLSLTGLEQLLAGEQVATKIGFEFTSDQPVSFEVDNVSLALVYVPEPASALWFGGLALAAFSRRRLQA